MSDLPGGDLEDTRAALAPTLDATAAILPWLAKPKTPRFPEELNTRWRTAFTRLVKAWNERHGAGAEEIRPAVFALFAIALETGDSHCLHLGEALASAADALELQMPPTRLIAALSATLESLNEPDGLEHKAFGERATHFSERLAASLVRQNTPTERSPILDRLFIDDARERLERMHEALAALPPDAYALKLEATELGQQAEHIELYGIVHLTRRLSACLIEAGEAGNLESEATRLSISEQLAALDQAIAAVDA